MISANFYAGISANELAMSKQILDIYRSRPVNIASIKDIEASDAVLILGEDVTNTAARLALALRQSVRNLGKKMAKNLAMTTCASTGNTGGNVKWRQLRQGKCARNDAVKRRPGRNRIRQKPGHHKPVRRFVSLEHLADIGTKIGKRRL